MTTTATISLPQRGRGRPSRTANETYQEAVDAFCEAIVEIRSRLDFEVSSRGWCYILEDHGLTKDRFDEAQRLINNRRKDGRLPLNICAKDSAREFRCIENLDYSNVEDEVDRIEQSVDQWADSYSPFSFWDDKDVYIQMLVEKIDLRSLFEPICRRYRIPIANAKGWSDLHTRGEILSRFRDHDDGRQLVLLYCGDFDPAGVQISDCMISNLREVASAEEIQWDPDDVIIDRFGLNYDFIESQGLTWIDNLITGGGNDLAYPKTKRERELFRNYNVSEWIEKYGKRKVEANSIVVQPDAGRELCEQAIQKWIGDESAIEQYEESLQPCRDELRTIVSQRFRGE